MKFAVHEPLHKDCASMAVNPWVDSFAASGPISNEYVSSQHTYLVVVLPGLSQSVSDFQVEIAFQGSSIY